MKECSVSPTRTIPAPDRTTLQLPDELRARLGAWASARHPREACGLMLGRRVGRAVRVTRVCEARNLETRARDGYEIDPVDHLAAEELARASGLEVVGVWHSHPDHPAHPSEADRAQAWSGWSYVIVSVVAGVARELRAWRLAGERFAEEPILP